MGCGRSVMSSRPLADAHITVVSPENDWLRTSWPYSNRTSILTALAVTGMGHRQSDAGDRSCTQLPDDDLDEGIHNWISYSNFCLSMNANLLTLQYNIAGASVSSCDHTTCRSLPYPKSQHSQLISRPEDSARAPSLVVLQLCKSMYRSWVSWGIQDKSGATLISLWHLAVGFCHSGLCHGVPALSVTCCAQTWYW